MKVSLKLSSFRINNSAFYNLGLDRWNRCHCIALVLYLNIESNGLTSAQPIAGDRGSIFACSAVTVETGTRGHSQGSLPKWSIHENCRGGYLCGDLLRGRYLGGDLLRGRYLSGDLIRGRYSLYKVEGVVVIVKRCTKQ